MNGCWELPDLWVIITGTAAHGRPEHFTVWWKQQHLAQAHRLSVGCCCCLKNWQFWWSPIVIIIVFIPCHNFVHMNVWIKWYDLARSCASSVMIKNTCITFQTKHTCFLHVCWHKLIMKTCHRRYCHGYLCYGVVTRAVYCQACHDMIRTTI